MLQAELKILGGKHQGKLIPLTSKKFLVGREQDCHLRPNSDLVSRHHCVFSIDDYAIRLRDLGSTNGTLVNGSNLRGEVILKSGDRVTIGKLELEVVIRQTNAKVPQVAPPVTFIPDESAVSTLTPQEMPTQNEGTETSYEIPSYTPTPPADAPAMPADTAIFGTPQPQYMQPLPAGYAPMMPPGYPMGGYMPPQYPAYAQGYGQPPGYGAPMGYPMAYPGMMPMPQGFPGAAIAAPPQIAATEVPETAADSAPEVRLPKPEDTGAKPAVPPPGSTGSSGGKKEDMPSTTAADIIKQYMNRRS